MDPALVRRAQRGDRPAFRAISEVAGERLKHVAYRILRDQHLAEDATQQALVEIWRSLPRLRDPERFDAWSYRFVVRACHRESRRARRDVRALADPRTLVAPDASGAVIDRDQLERGFRGLSIDHRAVVVLHYFLDLTMEDTAESLGISVGTAKSRLHRAMGKMRAALAADMPEGLDADRGITR